MGEDLSDYERVLRLEPSDERFLQRGDLLAQLPPCEVPSLSTSGETLTIEESMNLEGENGERRNVGDGHEWSLRMVVLPPAAKTREPWASWDWGLAGAPRWWGCLTPSWSSSPSAGGSRLSTSGDPGGGGGVHGAGGDR